MNLLAGHKKGYGRQSKDDFVVFLSPENRKVLWRFPFFSMQECVFYFDIHCDIDTLVAIFFRTE